MKSKPAPKAASKSSAPKAAPKAALAKKGASSKTAPVAKAAEGKIAAAQAAQALEQPGIDPDELEEQQDAAAAASSSAGGEAAAAMAATGSQEMSASFKNFRHHPDMENFYRFIYENDLRYEALAIIDKISLEKQQRKLLKLAKTLAN